MQRTHWLAASVVVVLGLSWFGTAADQRAAANAAGGKSLSLKLLLPQDDAIVKVDGKEIPGNGEERKITVTTAKDKDYVLITAFWEPNNYTKITRPRKVVAKDGEITVDFRKPSDKEKDDIVVRFVPTPQEFVDAMCKLGKVTKDDVVYDLGCGDGRMVITAVKKFGAKKGVGVDIDPDLIKKCKEAAKKAGVADKVEFRVGDVLKVEDLSDATVVLLYMGDDINARLKPILKKTLKPGSRVVSHRFLMGEDWPPEKSETVKATYGEYPGYQNEIHLWTIKAQK
jgi:SAM-dependent methyltransferase